MADADFERKHPRHPGGSERGGQFAERPDWADRLSRLMVDDDPEEYRPGAWREATDPNEQYKADLHSRLAGAFLTRLGTREADRLASDTLEDLPWVEQMLTNGPHQIAVFTSTDGPLSQEQLREVGEFADALMYQFPLAKHDTLRLSIVAGNQGMVSKTAFAETIGGRGTILITRRVFRGEGAQPGWLMDSSEEAPLWQYIMAHEWAHATDRSTGQLTRMRTYMDAVQQGGMSDYAKKGGVSEGYAEAFAEWFMTGGNTDNPAVRLFAEEYGWGLSEDEWLGR